MESKNGKKNGKKAKKEGPDFKSVLEGPHKHLVEAIEHGSSDPAIIKHLKKSLKKATGYTWKS